MRFVGAGAPNKDHVGPPVEEAASWQLSHPAFVDRRTCKDECVQILDDQEFGATDAVTDRARLVVGMPCDRAP